MKTKIFWLITSAVTCGICLWGGHPFLAFIALCCAGLWMGELIEDAMP